MTDDQIPTTGQRVTIGDIAASIASEHYFTAADGYNGAHDKVGHEGGWNAPPQTLSLLTFCVLVLKNGFTVVGQSACADPKQFDATIGRKLAHADAQNKIWLLLGFRLRDRLTAAARIGFDPTLQPLGDLGTPRRGPPVA